MGRVLVVGCQPSVIEEGIGLSSPVAAAVDRAVDAVLEALAELCVPQRREEWCVIRRLFLSAFLVALAAVVVKSLPDLARYLKMREM